MNRTRDVEREAKNSNHFFVCLLLLLRNIIGKQLVDHAIPCAIMAQTKNIYLIDKYNRTAAEKK